MENTLSPYVFLPFLIAYFALRGYWASKADRRPVEEDRSFALDKLNILLMSIATLALPLLSLLTNWLEAFAYAERPALAVPNWIGGGAVLAVWGTLYVTRIDREEKMMIEKFGYSYLRYMAQTNRLLPKLT